MSKCRNICLHWKICSQHNCNVYVKHNAAIIELHMRNLNIGKTCLVPVLHDTNDIHHLLGQQFINNFMVKYAALVSWTLWDFWNADKTKGNQTIRQSFLPGWAKWQSMANNLHKALNPKCSEEMLLHLYKAKASTLKPTSL